jgi:WD40 repeat protein
MRSLLFVFLGVLFVTVPSQATPQPPRDRNEVEVTAAAFTPDGKQALTAYRANTSAGQAVLMPLVKLWDIATGKLVRDFTGHKGGVDYLAVLPDGKRALTHGYEGEFRLWDLHSGKEVRAWSGFKQHYPAAGLTPDGKRLLTWRTPDTPEDGKFELWDVSSGKRLRSFDGKWMTVRAIIFSPDGKLALVDCIPVGKYIRGGTGLVSVSGKEVEDWTTALLLDVENGKVLHSFELRERSSWTAAAFMPDGKSLILDNCERNGNPMLKGKAYLLLWGIATKKEVRRFEMRGAGPIPRDSRITGSADLLSILPNGEKLWSVDNDRMLRLWDTATGKELSAEEMTYGQVLAFSPAGKLVLTGGDFRLVDGVEYRTVKIWNLDEKKTVQVLSPAPGRE